MALTVTLAPLNGKIGVKKTQKFTATPAGAAEGAILSYEWFVDGTVQAEQSEATFDYVASSLGEKTIKVTATAHVEGSDETETANAETKLTVEKNKMTGITSVATADTPTVPFQGAYSAKVVVSGQPAGSTITHEWNNSQLGDKAAGTAITTDPIKLKCTSIVSHEDYDDFTIVSNEVTITVTKFELPGLVVTVTALPLTVKVGETYRVDCDGQSSVGDSDYAYKWDTGETTQTVTFTADALGTKVHTCEVTATNANYNPSIKTGSVTVTVEQGFDPAVDDVYVHPLPWRNSAYIWAGWWVMDEIEAITKAGGDWKNPPEDNRWKIHLQVLAKMLTDFPEVDVQESRNGRIVHRSALELGIIY